MNTSMTHETHLPAPRLPARAAAGGRQAGEAHENERSHALTLLPRQPVRRSPAGRDGSECDGGPTLPRLPPTTLDFLAALSILLALTRAPCGMRHGEPVQIARPTGPNRANCTVAKT